jgi:hypothetical protein
MLRLSINGSACRMLSLMSMTLFTAALASLSEIYNAKLPIKAPAQLD